MDTRNKTATPQVAEVLADAERAHSQISSSRDFTIYRAALDRLCALPPGDVSAIAQLTHLYTRLDGSDEGTRDDRRLLEVALRNLFVT